MPHTVALIPAHNEALTIRTVVDATRPHVDAVIVIDDGSTDGTAEALSGCDAHLIRHPDNAGKGRRLVEGLELAFTEGATQVVTLDADNQHDPADIPAFLAKAAEHPGALVLGDRSAQMDRMPRSRARGIRFGNFFIGWACGRRIADAQCGMRLYPAQLWRKVQLPPDQIDRFLFETAVLLHSAEAGVPFVFVPVDARYEGFVLRASHFDPIRDFLKIVGLVTRFLFSRRLQLRGLLVVLGISMQADN
ncbi:MAG: glycosyltransferase family 2 protein [Alphaproteobacteria bacterium]|nr:glycosyltransferase family 2 protein [Alphaproteobacteria bacterium]